MQLTVVALLTTFLASTATAINCPQPPIRRVPAEGQDCPKLPVDCRRVFCKAPAVMYVPCDCALETVVQDCPKSCCRGLEFRHFPSCHGVVGPAVPEGEN